MDNLLSRVETVATACRARSQGPLSAAERAACVAARIPTGYDALQQGALALTCWDDLAGAEDEWIGERRYEFCRSLAGLVQDAQGAGLRAEEIRAKATEAAETQCGLLLDVTENPETSYDRCKLALLQEAVRLFPRGLARKTLPPELGLRRWRPEDATEYAAIMTNPRIWEHLPDHGELDQMSSVDAATIIAAVNEGAHHRVFAIEVEGRPAGQVRVIFHPTVAGVRSGEVVYMLSDEYWGRGLMSKILPAFATRCFDELSLDVLVAWIHPDNGGSVRCAERAGFFRNQSHYESDLATATEHPDFQQYLCYRLDFADEAAETATEPVPLARAS